jgi:Uma2 family endonuclease
MTLANSPVEAISEVEAKPKLHISFEEYLRQYSGLEGARTEWLGGEVGVYPMSNNIYHQRLIHFLWGLLDTLLGLKQIGELVPTGLPMKYSDTHPAREPDLMVLFNDHLDRIQPTYIDGLADIVIEVISPESETRDRADKFLEYEAAGVPEYWLFDPLRAEADVYALGDDGRYRRVARDADGRLVSPSLPGFALDTAILWTQKLPSTPEIVALATAMLAASRPE